MEMENVFNRTEKESVGAILSSNVYNLIIGVVLLWGFFVNYIMVQTIPVESIATIDFRVFLVGYFASCFLGIMIFTKSDNPFISFIGYNFVVVPFGLIINLVVSQYNPDIVIMAIQTTGIVTIAMMILGTLFPAFFQKIHTALTVALFVVIIVQLFNIFFLGIDPSIIDWVVVFIFCGYIGYDWGRANAIPKTADNAVDSAAALYMDIINLFLRLLRIMGNRR